jgi:hypothetical protein
MKKRSLSEWASLGELMATLAVFVSLVFVILSINQNTAALQASTENFMFERTADNHMQVIGDPSLAALIVKKQDAGTDLTPIEAVRWEKWQLVQLDIWAMAYNRHDRGLLGTDEWAAWDRYFVELFSVAAERLSRDQWASLTYGFDADFWGHVGESLFPN